MYCELRQDPAQDPRCDRPAFHVMAIMMADQMANNPTYQVIDLGSNRMRWLLVCEDCIEHHVGEGWELIVNQYPRRKGIPALLEAW